MKNLFYYISFAIFFLFACRQPEKINLEKVIFHTTRCFGNCPVYHLEVNQKQEVKLHIEKYYLENSLLEIDSSKIGFYQGTISDSLFQKLKRSIENHNILNTTFDDEYCCDGLLISILIYYDGKKKRIKTMLPPENAIPLIDVLKDICKDESLYKSDSIFTIEQIPN